jgi:D-lactate dehydrogenase
MNILFYSTKNFERPYLLSSGNEAFGIHMTEKALSAGTAEEARGFDVVSVFTGDDVSAPVVEKLYQSGVRFIAVRAAGHDNVDLVKANELGIRVANVPEYSPYAIAEHALALMLALNRKLVLADKQVHGQDFTVGNLVGFDLHGKTIGIIGAGKTGGTLVKILHGFGCRLLGYDVYENSELTGKYGLEYIPLATLCRESDIISLHTCLTPQTKYMINRQLIELMKPGVMLINTSRGACIHTEDVLRSLENGHIGYFGTDVYEKERGLFFYDWSGREIQDEILKRLLALPNVLITPHQAFATREALTNIMQTTFSAISSWANGRHADNELLSPVMAAVGGGDEET